MAYLGQRTKDGRQYYNRKVEAYGLDPSFNNATIKVKANCCQSKKELNYDSNIPDTYFKVLRNDPVFTIKTDTMTDYVHVWPKKGVSRGNGDNLRVGGGQAANKDELKAKLDEHSFVGFALLPEDDNIIPIAISGTIKLLNNMNETVHINDKIIWDIEGVDTDADTKVRTGSTDGDKHDKKFILRRLEDYEYDKPELLNRVVGFAISNAKAGRFYRLVIVK